MKIYGLYNNNYIYRSRLIKINIILMKTASKYKFNSEELKQTLIDSGLIFYLLNFNVFGLT